MVFVPFNRFLFNFFYTVQFIKEIVVYLAYEDKTIYRCCSGLVMASAANCPTVVGTAT